MLPGNQLWCQENWLRATSVGVWFHLDWRQQLSVILFDRKSPCFLLFLSLSAKRKQKNKCKKKRLYIVMYLLVLHVVYIRIKPLHLGCWRFTDRFSWRYYYMLAYPLVVLIWMWYNKAFVCLALHFPNGSCTLKVFD